VSFNNDEDGDGLAALFGGITPQATPKPAEAVQPAAAPTPAAQPPAGAGYPAAAPAVAPVAPSASPGYPAAGSYDLPAPTATPPASAYPSAAPQYPGLSPAPTAAPQAPAPGYPVAPAPAPQYQAPASQAPATPYPTAQYPSPQAPPTQYPPTQSPTQSPPTQYPGLEVPAGYPGLAPQGTPSAPQSYNLPAPAEQPAVSPQPIGQQAPQYPAQAYPEQAQPAQAQPAQAQPAQAQPAEAYPAQGYAATPPADVAQPATYDLPPPAVAPSAPSSRSYDPTPAYDQAPSSYGATPAYDPAPGHDPAPAYDPTAGHRQTSDYEPLAAEPVAPGGQPAPLVPPAQEQFGAPAAASSYGASDYGASGYGASDYGSSDYGSSGPAVGGALIPQSVVPAGPLLPSQTAAVVTPEDIERATVGEKVGLALAVLTGPIGLLIAIVSAVRGGRRRGWLIGIARVSLVLGVLSTVATVILGVVYWNIRVDQMQHDELAAASAEFCAAAEADPAMVTPPTVGFPTQGNSIPETIDAMTAWTNRWTELAATSPAELRTGLELLAAKGQEIVDSVTQSRSVDDALNAQVIGSVEAQSGVSAWYTNYCVAP
jgi:hypothetical protein